MKIIDIREIKGTAREVKCPKGGFISNRILLASDGMGFTMTLTEIPKGKVQMWHYKNHLEACYCISGHGALSFDEGGEWIDITPGKTYVLDKHDRHYFQAIEDVVLLCVFNPPLEGGEVHQSDGSYRRSNV